MMIRHLGIALGLATATASAAYAQDDVAKKVSEAMYAQTAGKYVAPSCSATKNKHFKVSGAATYLSTAITTGTDRERVMRQAQQNALEAITQNGQDKVASAWYFYGRSSLFLGDLRAADTALARTVALAPDCKEEVSQLLTTAVNPLLVAGSEAIKAQQPDQALILYRQALAINPNLPQVNTGMARVFTTLNVNDSAAFYYRRIVETAGTDPKYAQSKKDALFNAGLFNIRAKNYPEAVSLLEQFTVLSPEDVDGKRALAQAYRANGDVEKARALDAEIGESSATGPSDNPELTAALALYEQKKYPEAAVALEKVLATEPTNITAIAALANAALAQKDGPKLVAAADKLVALEPLNKDALQLLREGFRLQKESKKASGIGERILSLPINVNVTGMTLSAAKVQLSGTALGLEAQDAKTGKAIAAAPKVLVFELLDKAGSTVSTAEVAVPALKAGETHNWSLDAAGEGISGYRYKIKG